MGQNCSKKLKFQLSNFTLAWSIVGKRIVHPRYELFKRTTAKNENTGQTYLKRHLN